MLTINLLPWRTIAHRKQQKRHQVFFFLSLLFSLFLCGSTHFLLNQHIAMHRQTIAVLKEKIAALSTGIRPMRPVTQSASNDGKNLGPLFLLFLQNNRKNVCFNALEIMNTDNQSQVIFSGNAISINELTDFLKNWPMASLFSAITIDSLKENNDHIIFSFTGHLLV